MGARPNKLVAVVMEKGWEQVVAVLGTVASGAAYLPIEAGLPKERLWYLLDHGQVEFILTQSRVDERVEWPAGPRRLCIDSDDFSGTDDTPLEPVQGPEDLAYVIFTSGSTGLPKGVMIDHRGAVNTIVDINTRFGVGSGDRVLALSSLSFDLSVYDVFGTLAAGGTIIMPSATETRDPSRWAQWIAQEGVTIWNSVPALMSLLVEYAAGHSAPPSCSSLRLVLMSGDWIPVNLPDQVRTQIADAQIISLGGATEASIWSIIYPIDAVDPGWQSIPYGRPMVNQQFHVLNGALVPCPVWVPGELYIGGVGLAKGYWRDEEKTRNSFITHPQSGERLYRTGDLGRYLPDGNIEFLGREDSQVKLRGYRIELGEIQFHLQQCQGVEACTIAVREDEPGEKRLVAYVVPKTGVEFDSSELRDRLRRQLPEYMVPSAFVPLERLPLTANGKVDRKALPIPTRAATRASSAVTVPRDALEQQMTKLWEKTLRVRPVQLNDDFFDLGGDSLVAMRLISQIRKLTGRDLPLATLLQAPTVGALAELLRTDGWSPSWSSLVPIEPGGSRPPFFCVHGAGGNVVLFRDLARNLAPDYPFYGLQPQGLDGGSHFTSVEKMASHYLDEIRELQPEGPYFLGGYCLGGLIAFEIAQRLQADGQRVAFLGMIDSLNCNGTPIHMSFGRRIIHFIEKARFHWANVAPLSLRDRLSYGRNKLLVAWERGLSRLRIMASHGASRLSFGNNGDGKAVFLHDVNEQAHFRYRPKVYSGKITLFGLRKNHSYVTDPQMGWGGLANGGMDLIELPMYPGGIFIEPHVQATATRLKECLDQAMEANSPVDILEDPASAEPVV
jgi:amino acid adenylation domain-containing protein